MWKKRAFNTQFILPNFKFIELDHGRMLMTTIGKFEKIN